jgi:hypothetical protein
MVGVRGGRLVRWLVTVPVVLLAALLPATPASAHGLAWLSQFGSTKADIGWSVAVTANAVYVTGEVEKHLPGQTSAGSVDAFVRKYATDGTLRWTRQFGTDAIDHGYGIAADATGVYVAGQTLGTFAGQTSRGGADAYLARFTPAGSLAWTVQFGTPKGDNGINVTTGPDGISVVGVTDGAFPGAHRRGVADAFLAQFDATGSMSWVRQFGSPEFDVPYGPAADANGIYVSGFTLGSFPGHTARGNGDAFLIAFAPDGSHRWTREFGTKRYDDSLADAVYADHVYVAGTTQGTLAGQTSHGRSDAYVRAFTTDGKVTWTRQFGTSGSDSGNGIAVDATGVFAVGATSGRFGHQPDPGRSDAFVRMLTATGDKGWTAQFGSSENDDAWWCVPDGSGGVYVAGDTYGTMPGQTSAGLKDAWVGHVT